MQNEIKVRFNLTGFECSADVITSKIGLNPTDTWKLGESISVGTLVYEENGWQLGVVHEEEVDLEVAVKKLLDMLEMSSEEIAELAEENYAEISCIVFAVECVPVLHFSRETLERITRLGAEIDIDLYCLTSNDD
jgi:hypothetical protein